MKNRYDNDVPTTASEQELLDAVKALLSSKGPYEGAEFRLAFMAEAMEGFCDACGNGGKGPCYCTRDD